LKKLIRFDAFTPSKVVELIIEGIYCIDAAESSPRTFLRRGVNMVMFSHWDRIETNYAPSSSELTLI
jgi:hypothetical protein